MVAHPVALAAVALELVSAPVAARLPWMLPQQCLAVVLPAVRDVVVAVGQAACQLAVHPQVAVKWHVCGLSRVLVVQRRVRLVRLQCQGGALRWQQQMGQ